jgi:hypothetical protein
MRFVVTDVDKPAQLTIVPGDRAALERELLWNIALDGDLMGREQLCRMLTRAANTELAIAPAIEPGEQQPPQ